MSTVCSFLFFHSNPCLPSFLSYPLEHLFPLGTLLSLHTLYCVWLLANINKPVSHPHRAHSFSLLPWLVGIVWVHLCAFSLLPLTFSTSLTSFPFVSVFFLQSFYPSLHGVGRCVRLSQEKRPPLCLCVSPQGAGKEGCMSVCEKSFVPSYLLIPSDSHFTLIPQFSLPDRKSTRLNSSHL